MKLLAGRGHTPRRPPSVPLFVRGRRNKKVPEDVHPQALCYSFTVIAWWQF